MSESTVVSSISACFIEVIHRRSNPTMWIVTRSRKRLFFYKKRISSHWFVDERQAWAYARAMKREHEAKEVALQDRATPRG